MPSRDQVLDFIEKNVHGYAKSTEQLLIEYLNKEINFNKNTRKKYLTVLTMIGSPYPKI